MIGRTSRRPRGLLGMLALVLAIEAALAGLETDFADVSVWDWRLARQAASRVRGREILFFGDSTMKLGVAPRLLGARAGANLAVNGGQAPSSYFLLRRALAAGARPEAIVVTFMPPLLAMDQRRNARLWMQALGPLDLFEFGRAARDGELIGTVALAGMLPSCRDRYELREAIAAALAGRAATHRDGTRTYRRNWRVNRGAQIFPATDRPLRVNPQFQLDEDIVIWYGVSYPAPWQPDPVNARFVRKFLGLAEAHRIPVYWLLTPLDAGAQYLSECGRQDQRIGKYLDTMLDRHPGLTLIDGRHAPYDRSALLDAVHLNRRGATALSRDLGAILAQHLDGPRPRPRRVALPGFGHDPSGPFPEDLDESRRIVLGGRAGGGVRR